MQRPGHQGRRMEKSRTILCCLSDKKKKMGAGLVIQVGTLPAQPGIPSDGILKGSEREEDLEIYGDDPQDSTRAFHWTTSPCCLLVGCLTSRQHATVYQGRICLDHCTCCHTEVEVAHQTFYLTRSQYTDTGLTSPSADPTTPGEWQGSH